MDGRELDCCSSKFVHLRSCGKYLEVFSSVLRAGGKEKPAEGGVRSGVKSGLEALETQVCAVPDLASQFAFPQKAYGCTNRISGGRVRLHAAGDCGTVGGRNQFKIAPSPELQS